MINKFDFAESLEVSDKFKRVNTRDETIYVVHRVSDHHVFFCTEKGHVEMAIEKDVVVEKIVKG